MLPLNHTHVPTVTSQVSGHTSLYHLLKESLLIVTAATGSHNW